MSIYTPPDILFAKGRYGFALLVHLPRIELGWILVHGILSPTRLPVPPKVHITMGLIDIAHRSINTSILIDNRVSLLPLLTRITGALGKSRTFTHWFLRPAALPVCILMHINCGATIVLNDTNPARKRVCTN